MTPCSRPILKNCSGEGRTECRTEYETSCSATYPAPDSAPAPASCVKLPVSFCGRGCVTAAGEEQCSEKTTDVLREVPGHTRYSKYWANPHKKRMIMVLTFRGDLRAEPPAGVQTCHQTPAQPQAHQTLHTGEQDEGE